MKIIEQSHEIQVISPCPLFQIEQAGRTCYQSMDKITPEGSEKFVKMLRDKEHHAMIEFGDITVKFITNRGVTHELVRHRHCSFAQESTRYVKYDGEMEFIKPVWFPVGMLGKWELTDLPNDHTTKAEDIWLKSMLTAEQDYQNLLKEKWTAQQARELLPNSLKTEIVMKANIREWRHVLQLRCAKSSHPQMVAIMRPLLEELKTKIPVVFDDII